MSEETGAAPTEPSRGFLSNLMDMYLAPGEAFGHILRKPSPWLPLIVLMAIQVAFTAVWMQKVDARGFMEAQIEESGRASQIPPDQFDQVVEQQAKFLPIMAWAGPFFFMPVFVLLCGGLFLFVYRFFYAGELGFKESLTVVVWSFVPISLLSSPLILLVLQLKDDWTLNPQTALQANLSLLLSRQDVGAALWSLSESIDLFSFWTMFLLAAGYAVSTRKGLGSTIWGVVVPWAIYVAGKVGLAAAFS